MSDPLRNAFHKRFLLRYLVPALCAIFTATTAAGLASFYLTQRGDEIALHRQEREAQAAITRNVAKIASEQETVAIWDEPLFLINQKSADLTWLHKNIGAWLYSLFGHDGVYILDARDRPLYAMQAGEQVPAAEFARLRRDVQPFIDGVRGRTHPNINLFERLPGVPPPKGSEVLTSVRAIHATDLAKVDGRPAIVSVMRMVPYTGAFHQEAGTEPLLISIRYLDDNWMTQLARYNMIDGARYSASSRTRATEASSPLKSSNRSIGYLVWKPEHPGSLLRADLGWVWMSVGGVFFLVCALLAQALYRSAISNFRSETVLQKTVLELRASEAQAQHLAFHDVLTGLPNRALLNDRLLQALSMASQTSPVAILLLDIDRFKYVNDTLGHLAGDALIREFARRVSEFLDGDSTLARLGGDEFAIVVPAVKSAEALAALCVDILYAIRQPFHVGGAQAFVGTSIGVATAPEFGIERLELMRKADIALYQAKADGRGCFRLFALSMDESVKARSVVEAELRQAIVAGDQLELFYQPQVSSQSGQVIGFEALLRWHHPEHGSISPTVFIPVAEECGLIDILSEWVLREACGASREWPEIFIAVNLSPLQFRTTGFAERIIEIVQQEAADPSHIELEITENVLVQNDVEVATALETLRTAGFRIALDDFGTGYSSLSYLRSFEVDKIKIDRSFVQNFGASDTAAIISAVVTLGHAMGLQVTAEGVETADQSRFLTDAGCDILQGYFFSKAVRQAEAAALLDRDRSCLAA